jgi:hypothetical protein
LPNIASESIIEEEDEDDVHGNPHSFPLKKKNGGSSHVSSAIAPDHKNISVNLLKNFEEIMQL